MLDQYRGLSESQTIIRQWVISWLTGEFTCNWHGFSLSVSKIWGLEFSTCSFCYKETPTAKLPCFELISFKWYIWITQAMIDQEIYISLAHIFCSDNPWPWVYDFWEFEGKKIGRKKNRRNINFFLLIIHENCLGIHFHKFCPLLFWNMKKNSSLFS